MTKFLFCLFILSLNASELCKSFPAIFPAIYTSGKNPKKIELFIGFDCNFCKQAILDLINFLKTNPAVEVKIYYYATSKSEKIFVYYFLAAETNLNLLKDLYCNFVSDDSRNLTIIQNQNPNLVKNLRSHKLLYDQYYSIMDKEFEIKKIDTAPTWIINGQKFLGLINLAKIVK